MAKEWNSAEELWLFVCGERAIFTELVTLKGCSGQEQWGSLLHTAAMGHCGFLSAWVVETREYAGTGSFSCDELTVLCASFSLAGMASSVGSLWPH